MKVSTRSAKHSLRHYRHVIGFLALVSGGVVAGEDVRPFNPKKGTASISGTVRFKGTPPKPVPVKMHGHDPQCAAMHKDNPLMTSDVVVGPKGGLKNVFVRITRGLESYEFISPEKPVELDQKSCVFVPRVFGVMVDQPILIRNSDPTVHNVHMMCQENEEINFIQPKKGQSTKKVLSESEGPFLIKCDIHPWMKSWCTVMEHPFFAVSAEDGSFAIKGLPPGTFTLSAWHEKYGQQTIRLKLADKESKKQEFSFPTGKK